jgi:hypothetical protein
MSDSTVEPKEYPIPTQPQRQPTIPRKPIPASTTSTSSYHSPKPTPRPQTIFGRVKRRWSLFSRRTRIFIVVGLLALLALILGLAIGLSTRKPANLPLPSAHGGPYEGDLTYYAPGLGACGITSSSSENIVAVSHILFDSVQSGSDPNSNPLCGRRLRAKRVKEGAGERSVDLTVVDRCTGCAQTDIDVSLSVFNKLADEDLGRVLVTWSWLD